MSRIGNVITSSKFNIVLFVIAAVLLLGSIVGGTQAALGYYSDTYLARLQASDIGVTLTENDQPVAFRNYETNNNWDEQVYVEGTEIQSTQAKLLQNMLGESEKLQLGKEYTEELAVQNTGEITQYVRVDLLKYWIDAEGNKVNTVSPDLIKLTLNTTPDGAGNQWLLDAAATTPERTALYYNNPLAAGETTIDFCKAVAIDPAVATKATQTTQKNEDGTTTITTTYEYNGLRFCLQANVFAVQEHNIENAARSAWGADVTANNGTLNLG